MIAHQSHGLETGASISAVSETLREYSEILWWAGLGNWIFYGTNFFDPPPLPTKKLFDPPSHQSERLFWPLHKEVNSTIHLQSFLYALCMHVDEYKKYGHTCVLQWSLIFASFYRSGADRIKDDIISETHKKRKAQWADRVTVWGAGACSRAPVGCRGSRGQSPRKLLVFAI